MPDYGESWTMVTSATHVASSALRHGFGPTTFGEFTIERELGRGGMGVVYLARDQQLDRQVAIKLLLSDSTTSSEQRERFVREARIAGRLSHPHIVPVYGILDGDQLGIVTAYIECESLADRIATRGPMEATEAARVLREIAWALGYAHSRGVIHRDVKPQNVLIERGSGRAFLTDFGIARDLEASRLTTTGTVLGSVHYMSPEQASGASIDGRSDLYSLGATGYYAVTGAVPIDGPSIPSVLVNLLTVTPRPVRDLNDRVPITLAAAIEHSLEKAPDQRFDSAEAFADSIAPLVGQRSEVAPLLRSWITRGEATLVVLVLWMLPAVLRSNSDFELLASNPHASVWRERLFAFVAGAVPALTVAFLTRMWDLRQLVRAGFTLADVRFGVMAYATQRSEEIAARRQRATERERWLRRLSLAGGTIASAAVIYLILSIPARSVMQALSGMLTAMLVLMYVVTVSGLWNAIRHRRSRVWNSRVGAFLFRLAKR